MVHLSITAKATVKRTFEATCELTLPVFWPCDRRDFLHLALSFFWRSFLFFGRRLPYDFR